MTNPNWKNVLPSPPQGGRIQEAWMTSFEQPDAGLLVEHLLPSLFHTSHSLSQEYQERNLFFCELGTALEALHGRLTVISSPSHGERKESQYPWLWRYVNHFNVGSETRAVQHAKLWAFHWKVGNQEQLELHVSSTNLTSSAFKDQLQAGWQVTLPLGKTTSQSTHRRWGEFIPFLEALGASSGTIGATRIQRLITLLGRAERPDNVEFIASVPGGKSAARQLAKYEPSEIHIFTPTIGDWNPRNLVAWSADVGIAIKKVHLKWISESHRWAKPNQWTLTSDANEALGVAGVRMEKLPDPTLLSSEHKNEDIRWSHAKLYLLRSRQKRRLLVTSANWSASAWGAGQAAPRNFELGIIFESEWTNLEKLDEPFDPPETVTFCVDRTDIKEHISALEWAEASWDGKRIVLHARSSDRVAPISVVVTFTGNTGQNIPLVNGKASFQWSDARKTPLVARFMQETEVLDVDFLDIRPLSDFAKTPLPEVDPGAERALRDAFLLQRYGGPVVDPESIFGLGGKRMQSGAFDHSADYAVQAWVETRAAFSVVDKWRNTLTETEGDNLRREQVLLDGYQLQNIFRQRHALGIDPGAGLVAEEISWRLNDEKGRY